MPGAKLFRDPVHGYISIPTIYCENFIDHAIFQRLRRIEQTGMRVLYPSAHHDRFSHSLGVFYLGQLAYGYLEGNSEILKDKEELKKSFELACLLHDCAHAPFSHTFEKHYERNKENDLPNRLIRLVTEPSFSKDLDNFSPSAHEIVSSIVVLELFSKYIADLGGDLNLIARMITGCKYSSTDKGIENCLISLLNGFAIDVDKLDYIIRDTWASGVNNIKIDERRLLSSLIIRKDKDGIYKIFFKKHALNVIKNAIDARNFLYEWVYSHHKVEYEQYLITTSIDKLSKLESTDEEFSKSLFSIDSLYSAKSYKDYCFFLPSDGDLIYFLKKHFKNIPEAEELLSRKYLNKAVWKTKAEYNFYLDDINDMGRKNIFKRAQSELNNFFKTEGIAETTIVKEIKIKTLVLQKDEIFIDLDGEDASFTKLFPEKIESSSSLYFIPFIPVKGYVYKKEVIKLLRSLK